MDFNINKETVGIDKDNYNSKHQTKEAKKIVDELTEFGKQYGFDYGANFKDNIDLVHFYANEEDYGYKNRDEAMEVNDKYKKEHGDNIPLYNPINPSKDKKQ